jgi:hypothetical protein
MLVKGLKTAQTLLKTKETKPHFTDDPHVTIASKLLPWQYEKGWLEYSHRHFTGRFVATDMLLLKKGEGMKGYRTVQKFAFMNMPVVTKQGELF